MTDAERIKLLEAQCAQEASWRMDCALFGDKLQATIRELVNCLREFVSLFEASAELLNEKEVEVLRSAQAAIAKAEGTA